MGAEGWEGRSEGVYEDKNALAMNWSWFCSIYIFR